MVRPMTKTMLAALTLAMAATGAVAHEPGAAAEPTRTTRHIEVGRSELGPDDELGRMAWMTDQSRRAVLSSIDPAARTYDLGTDYFVGMPSFAALGDPGYQFWMTHTPRGTAVDDPAGVGHAQNATVSYTGDAVSFYTHMGTHIDALNHFGLHGLIWNGFDPDKELGDKGWRKTGAETIPPIVARGVMIDVAAAKGVDMLAPVHRVTAADLREALARQRVTLQRGDVVLIRTGRMALFEDAAAFIKDPPGLSDDGAAFLADAGAMIVGADNLSLETFPSLVEGDWVPVHTYLLAHKGVPIIELAVLEELSRDRVYEFAFIGGSIKFRGASAAPMRPIAIPLRR